MICLGEDPKFQLIFSNAISTSYIKYIGTIEISIQYTFFSYSLNSACVLNWKFSSANFSHFCKWKHQILLTSKLKEVPFSACKNVLSCSCFLWNFHCCYSYKYTIQLDSGCNQVRISLSSATCLMWWPWYAMLFKIFGQKMFEAFQVGPLSTL